MSINQLFYTLILATATCAISQNEISAKTRAKTYYGQTILQIHKQPLCTHPCECCVVFCDEMTSACGHLAHGTPDGLIPAPKRQSTVLSGDEINRAPNSNSQQNSGNYCNPGDIDPQSCQQGLATAWPISQIYPSPLPKWFIDKSYSNCQNQLKLHKSHRDSP